MKRLTGYPVQWPRLELSRIRLEHNIDNLSSAELLLGISRGRIVDANIAVEASEMAKNTILSNAANQMMANANNNKQMLLRLLS